MRNGHDRFDSDHRRQALDGVQRAEGFADRTWIRFAATLRAFDREQLRIGDRQVFFGLDEVGGDELLEVRRSGHATCSARSARMARTSAMIESGVKGLARNAVAPACSTRSRDWSSPRVVTIKTGSARRVSCARTNSKTSTPPMSGMLRSSTKMSKRASDNRSMASSPLEA